VQSGPSKKGSTEPDLSALEVRFVLRAAGTTSYLTIRPLQVRFWAEYQSSVATMLPSSGRSQGQRIARPPLVLLHGGDRFQLSGFFENV
jgi:hypothetical protein